MIRMAYDPRSASSHPGDHLVSHLVAAHDQRIWRWSRLIAACGVAGPMPEIAIAESTDPADRRATLRDGFESAVRGPTPHAVLRAPRIFPSIAKSNIEQERQHDCP
jgi:hypothetical protein